MNTQNVIAYYKSRFQHDPLYRKIKDKGYLQELFENKSYFFDVSLHDNYSSKHAAELLSLRDPQTLVNYNNREELKGYLNVQRYRRFYRYDHICLFKFKMIILLNHYNYTPLEIVAITEEYVEKKQNIHHKIFGESLKDEALSSETSTNIKHDDMQKKNECLEIKLEQYENNINNQEQHLLNNEIHSLLLKIILAFRDHSKSEFDSATLKRIQNTSNEIMANELVENTLKHLDEIKIIIEEDIKQLTSDRELLLKQVAFEKTI